jgi:hypothetical protein
VSGPEQPRCERFHLAVSLQLDGELSGLETALHLAHARRCADCRAYAADVWGIAEHLRASPLHAPSRHVVARAPASARRSRRLSFSVAAVVAAIVAAGTAAGRGSGDVDSPQARQIAYLESIDDERRLLGDLARPGRPSWPARAPGGPALPI